MFSYEALRSRLEEGRFVLDGMRNVLSPVIRLSPLTCEEMLVLIEKVAEIHAGLFEYGRRLSQQELIDFIRIEFGRIGADAKLTPREVIRDFIELLNIVYQNPEVNVAELLNSEKFEYAKAAAPAGEVPDKEFEEFEL